MIHQSGEDYLETILLLKREKGCVRSIDIAQKLGYSKPSISRAMANLKKDEYIQIDDKGIIEFTTKGLEKAEQIYDRHLILKNFLLNTIGVSEEIAEKDACKIEHILSEETFEKIKQKMK